MSNSAGAPNFGIKGTHRILITLICIGAKYFVQFCDKCYFFVQFPTGNEPKNSFLIFFALDLLFFLVCCGQKGKSVVSLISLYFVVRRKFFPCQNGWLL